MEAAEQRGRRRRLRGALAGLGSMGRSHAVGSVDDGSADDEVSDLDINERVEQRVVTPAVQIPVTPRSRMAQVRNRASVYEREQRLVLLHKMLLRKTPLDVIADELDVSVATIIRDRAELFRMLRKEAMNLDLSELIGDSLGFYREIQALALRQASMKDVPLNLKLAALRTALSARNDSAKFLHVAGVFDVLQYVPEDRQDSSDLEKLGSLVDKLLSEDDDEMHSLAGETGVSLADLEADLQGDEEEEDNLRLFT